MAASSLSSSSPCAACKFLRRKCQSECGFAPYFPPDQPQKFANVHKVFGASNVTKLLNELHPHQREDSVNSLAYEADMRLRDPVYGCVGVISLLQHQLRQLQMDLTCTKSELSKYRTCAKSELGGGGVADHGSFIDADAAAAHNHHQQGLGTTLSLISGTRDIHHLGQGGYLQHHQFFPSSNQQAAAAAASGSSYDCSGVLGMNVAAAAGIGQLSHHFQHPAVGGNGGRTVEDLV